MNYFELPRPEVLDKLRSYVPNKEYLALLKHKTIFLQALLADYENGD